MQGARRRPYVDMVEEGNEATDRPGRNPEGRSDPGAFLRRGPSKFDIFLRALLLEVPPASSPSHTCAYMK